MAPPKPSEALRAFHNKNTDNRSLIWPTEPDKRGLPLDGFAIDRHFTSTLKSNIYTNSTKKLLKVFLTNWCTRIDTYEQCYNTKMSDANGFQRRTLLFRFFNIKKMAANCRKRAMHNGQYWVFEGLCSEREHSI